MVVTSIGSIMTSLLPPSRLGSAVAPSDSALTLRTRQIFLLSASSTLARLLTGLVADYLCPTKLRRSTLVATCCALLALIFAYSAGVLESVKGIWVLSLGVGWLYGALFTLAVRYLAIRCLPRRADMVGACARICPFWRHQFRSCMGLTHVLYCSRFSLLPCT